MIKTIFTAALIFLASTVNVVAEDPVVTLGPPATNGKEAPESIAARLYQHLQDVSVLSRHRAGKALALLLRERLKWRPTLSRRSTLYGPLHT